MDYAYTCSANVECLIDTITYFNQGSAVAFATIKFWSEDRPSASPVYEAITYATGNAIRTITKRIKTIQVNTSAGLVRAYGFTYDSTSYSHLSRLFSVQEFGSDAILDAVGNITAGSALPANSFTYSDQTYTGPFSGVAYANIPATGVLNTADLNADGFTDLCTAWITGGDALLARDLNSNGRIDSQSELFGTATQSGFAALTSLDSNADGLINGSDTAFATLRVWQDSNHNGITDPGELKTLTEAGIASISLAATVPAITTASGNTITLTDSPAAVNIGNNLKGYGNLRVDLICGCAKLASANDNLISTTRLAA